MHETEPQRAWSPPGHEGPSRETVLRRLNRWQAEEQREDLADLYVECTVTAPGEEFRSREDFVDRLVSDARSSGFSMLIAETETMTGFVFGVPLERDGGWWHGFDGVLPPAVEQLTASGHVFAVTELVVHPYAREHGVAGHLLERLLADNQASLAVTLIPATDHVVYGAFQSWGWQEIGELRRAPDTAVLRVLVLRMGTGIAADPGALTHNIHTQRPEVT